MLTFDEIINSLKSKGESGEQKDGMDAVLCSWDKKTNTLEFACANNPLFLVRDNKINDFKEYGFMTLEMDAEWIKSIKRQDDLILQFGGRITNMHVDGYDNNTLPQVHRDRYSNKATETSSFFTLQYRLYDIGSRDFLDSYNDSKLFNMGPVLVISYETLDNPLAKNLMSFFNPDAASHAITKTETWSMYVKFDW